MKQRSAAFAIWMALFVALAVTLSLTLGTNRPGVAGTEIAAEGAGVKTAIHPWPEAAEVRVFVEDIPFDEFERTGKNMSKPDGIVLTKSQRAVLDKAVHLYRMTPKEYENNAVVGCFIPHHFFRYYDKKGRQIGEMAVCYCCGGIEFSPAIKWLRPEEEWQFEFEGVEQMLKEMGVPTDVNC
ncbi:hypothetical protein [Sphingopyxis sp.]|uniref:hypothetical protein n=1 Tax=Sphingopyxis sp. TaxID=1908224 RepID=UPI0025D940DC|nr:hypothetical protein [Sphingopyxis sp.]MBK6412537.1 hypothetical protein [Sphingopyxis sp.]